MAVLIKNVSEKHWREFKSEAARRGITLGELFNAMVEAYLSKKRAADNAWDDILSSPATLTNDEAAHIQDAIQEFKRKHQCKNDHL